MIWKKTERKPLTGGLHDALQDHHDLKLLVHEGALGQVEEGTFGIDLVADGQRGDQEKLVCPGPETHIQFTLVQRQKLTLGRLTRLKERERRGQEKKNKDNIRRVIAKQKQKNIFLTKKKGKVLSLQGKKANVDDSFEISCILLIQWSWSK